MTEDLHHCVFPEWFPIANAPHRGLANPPKGWKGILLWNRAVDNNCYSEPFAVRCTDVSVSVLLAWLNLWDKHMTTGRINQIDFFQSYGFNFFKLSHHEIISWNTHMTRHHTMWVITTPCIGFSFKSIRLNWKPRSSSHNDKHWRNSWFTLESFLFITKEQFYPSLPFSWSVTFSLTSGPQYTMTSQPQCEIQHQPIFHDILYGSP